MDNFYSIFRTAFGYFGVVKNSKGILRVVGFFSRAMEVKTTLFNEFKGRLIQNDQALLPIKNKINHLLTGRRVKFSEKLFWGQAGEFERLVWRAAASIGWGKTRSYQWIANKIGRPKTWRAVGNALGRNPMPLLVPCHRVIASNGKLGGYAFGKRIKQNLLELEGRVS